MTTTWIKLIEIGWPRDEMSKEYLFVPAEENVLESRIEPRDITELPD